MFSYNPVKKILLLVLISACNRTSDTKHAQSAGEIALILESPDRHKWQMPDRVIRELKLRNGLIVADLGAGTGYFARRIAEKIAPKGISFGYDINPTMVEYMRRDAEERHLAKNYKAELLPSHTPTLDKNRFDLIFLCNTYQYLEPRKQYIATLKEALKPGGRIVVIDFTKLEKADEESGEVPENLVDKDTVKKDFKAAGLRLIRDLKFLPSQFFLEFSR